MQSSTLQSTPFRHVHLNFLIYHLLVGFGWTEKHYNVSQYRRKLFVAIAKNKVPVVQEVYAHASLIAGLFSGRVFWFYHFDVWLAVNGSL